nr:extensin family protein [Acuticoccus mangrovi]
MPKATPQDAAPPIAEADRGRSTRFDPGDDDTCIDALKAAGAAFTIAGALEEEACGAPRVVRMKTVGGISLGTETVLRCPAALALARWVSEVVAPSARLHLAEDVATVAVGTTYQCRMRRTGATSVRLSEHAFANAIDVSGVVLADGERVMVKPRPDSAEAARAFQAAIRGGACALFTTVLGPTTNALHDDHLHLDLAPRRGGARLCE